MYQSDDYAGALEKFKEALAVYASPKIWFNIGQANRDLGRFDDAMLAFGKFLTWARDVSPNAIADARKAMDELKPKLGQLRVKCQTPAAEVNIDGKVLGQAPLLDPIWTMPGRHQITALSAGEPPSVQTVNVVAGTEILVNLEPNSWAVTVPVEAPAAAPLRTSPGRKWTWVAAGSTVVFAGTAAIVGLMMQSKLDSLRRSCGRDSPAHLGCSQSDVDSVTLRKDTANVFWGLTAAAAVTTGTLFYFESRPVAVAPLVGELNGLLLSVRY